MRFGMDFGGTNLKFGIFEENGEAIKFQEEKLIVFTNKGDLLSGIIAFSKRIIGTHSPDYGGMAIKGLVDVDEGVILEDIGAGNLLAGKSLKQIFEAELQMPFVIDNDARSYMLGEWKFGAGQGSHSLVCMTLGTGIGCSVIAKNKPYYGSDVLGGLLGGHISIDRHGPECSCGQKGCLELYCSAPALINRVGERLPELKNSDDPLPPFFHLVQQGNEPAREVFLSFIDDLSVGIVNTIHAFNPRLVILGGGIMNSKAIIIPPLIELVHKRAWTYPRNKVEIRAAKLGNKAAALGVAFHPQFEH